MIGDNIDVGLGTTATAIARFIRTMDGFTVNEMQEKFDILESGIRNFQSRGMANVNPLRAEGDIPVHLNVLNSYWFMNSVLNATITNTDFTNASNVVVGQTHSLVPSTTDRVSNLHLFYRDQTTNKVASGGISNFNISVGEDGLAKGTATLQGTRLGDAVTSGVTPSPLGFTPTYLSDLEGFDMDNTKLEYSSNQGSTWTDISADTMTFTLDIANNTALDKRLGSWKRTGGNLNITGSLNRERASEIFSGFYKENTPIRLRLTVGNNITSSAIRQELEIELRGVYVSPVVIDRAFGTVVKDSITWTATSQEGNGIITKIITPTALALP